MRVWFAALLVLSATTSSCTGTSCSDVNWSSKIALTIEQPVLKYVDSVRVRVCDASNCGDVTLPVEGPSIEVSMNEFGEEVDGSAPETVTVSALAKSGALVAQTTGDLEFDDWQPDGPGCGTWGRAEVAVSAADLVAVPRGT